MVGSVTQPNAGIPKNWNDDVVKVKKHNEGEVVWKELLLYPTLVVRHILILTIGLHFFQQTSGVDVVVLYNPTILMKAGITNSDKKLLCTTVVGFVKTIFIFISTFMLN
ncbi:hypothetical protein ACE6H2_027075 [Prunus campanulata]